jgi:hypothetical protein
MPQPPTVGNRSLHQCLFLVDPQIRLQLFGIFCTVVLLVFALHRSLFEWTPVGQPISLSRAKFLASSVFMRQNPTLTRRVLPVCSKYDLSNIISSMVTW